jgi:hypothetical protein
MIWNAFIVFYAAVTIFSLGMMIQERLQKSGFGLLDFLIGIVACLAWPVAWLIVFLAARRQRRAAHSR